MIDYMSYKQAKELVGLIELIAEKEEKRQQAPAISLSQFFLSSPRGSV
jgi:hypothetical protein